MDEINNDEIFKLLKQMPKGVIHHLHGDCALDPGFVIFIFYNNKFFEEFAYQDTTYYNPQTCEIRYHKLIKLRFIFYCISTISVKYRKALNR